MKFNRIALIVIGAALTTAPALAQDKAAKPAAQTTNVSKVATGQKTKMAGVIVKREADSFLLRDANGGDYQVVLNNFTKVEEKKSNFFRSGKNYNTTMLLRGLIIEVEGKGDGSGALVADKIKIKDNDLMVARTVESRVVPVEGRVGEAEGRITNAEENAKRLSGQLDELSAITSTVRGEAKAANDSARNAQATADSAVAGVEATNKRMETWISSLDDYEAKRGITVNFKVAKFDLSPEAKAALDEIAAQAKTERGYVIEVMGFASADGDENKNRVLSQKRADAVVRYLAENHMIPLRRIITPFGYGESNAVGDNATKEGREQNRRVEVKVLVNKGITGQPAPVQMQRSTATSLDAAGRPREATKN
jgi:outer membrane protein OmpA-like peptidoglycan-associated protein